MRLIPVLIFLVFCLLFQFSKCTPDVAGNSTQTGNPVLSGKVLEPDGKLPAVNAKVLIRKRGDAVIFDTSSYNPGAAELSLTTDKNGCYKVDSLDPGLYVIEAKKGSEKSFHDSIKITDSVQNIIDTLGATGKIIGTIYLSEGGDPRKVFVLIHGLNRFVVPDSNGVFIFDSLAKADYDLRFIPTLDLYGVFDTSGIAVFSEKTTYLDTIKLPFLGIPSVKNIKVTFDSLMSVAKIQWDKADTVSAGFNIYRKTITSNSEIKMNPVPVTDTFIFDSSVVNGYKYEYRLTAVGKKGNEGPCGIPSDLVVNTPLKLIATYGGPGTASGRFSSISDLKILPDGKMVIVDISLDNVQILDSAGNFIRAWGANVVLKGPTAVTTDDSSNIFVLEMSDPGRVQQFDTLGNFIRRWTVQSFSNSISYGFNRLYVYHGKLDTLEAGLEILELDNNSISRISLPGTNFSGMLRMGDYFLFSDHVQQNLMIMDTLDYIPRTWINLTGISFHPFRIAFFEDRVVALNSNNGRLFVFDSTGNFLSRFNLAEIAPGGNELIFQRQLMVAAFDSKSHDMILADHNYIYRYNIP